MRGFTASQIESLLKLPYSTIRHWQQTIYIIQPHRDEYGKRIFTEYDVRIFCRLKHLVHIRGLGLQTAHKALLSELASPESEKRAYLEELRAELLDALCKLRRLASIK